MNTSDSITLSMLAHKCPSVDGAIIHDARGLYSLIYNISMRNDLGCDSIDGGGGDRKGNKSVHTIVNGKQQYSLYPNPNDGYFTLQQSISQKELVNAEILNATGICIFKSTLNFTGGITNLMMPNKIPGLYLLKITESNGNSFALKFVIE